MVLEICGESISIPNGIADWCHENPDNRTEFDGMIESMIWAIQKKYKPSASKPNEEGDWFTQMFDAYAAMLGAKKD